VAKKDRHKLASLVRTVLDHLIRLAASPATQPRAGWRATIVRVRGDIEALLGKGGKPGMKPTVAEVIAAELPDARRLALLSLKEHGETPCVPLDQLGYTEEQVLGPWLP
jgi:Domain of unknown function DUF29